MSWLFLSLFVLAIYGYVHVCVQAVLVAAYDNGAAVIPLFWGAFALECQVLERDENIRKTKFQYNFYPTFLAK